MRRQLLLLRLRYLARCQETRIGSWATPSFSPSRLGSICSLQSPPLYPSSHKRPFHSTTLSCGRHHCPHSILGVSKHASLADVKRSFIQLALKHHPDCLHANNNNDENGSGSSSSSSSSFSSSPDRFIQIRLAFEEIISKSSTKSKPTAAPTGWSKDDLEDWWSHQEEATTKDFLTFDMSDSVRQEVIQVYRTMSAGGKDKGGYWDMARQLAEREEAAGVKQTGEPTRLLTASEQRGVTRRKRNR